MMYAEVLLSLNNRFTLFVQIICVDEPTFIITFLCAILPTGKNHKRHKTELRPYMQRAPRYRQRTRIPQREAVALFWSALARPKNN